MRFFAFAVVASLVFFASSCTKEDVSYDDMNANYVVTPDGGIQANADGSFDCPWCGATILPGNYCLHTYGYGEDCGDLDCRFYGTGLKHCHIFDVCSWGHAEHYHIGGGAVATGHTH